MKPLRLTGRALLAACAMGLGLTSIAHAQTPPVQLLLQPCDAQGAPTSGPGYFVVQAQAGSDVTLDALVGNSGAATTRVSLVPVDARSGVFGGLSYNLPQQPRKHVGAWVRMTTQKVTVAPGKGAVIPFTVHVPAGLKPGQYVGGLTAFVPVRIPGHQAHGHVGSIQVQFRTVTAVEIDVPGSTVGKLSITKVQAQTRPDAVWVIANIHNGGDLLLKGQGNLWLWKQGQKNPVISAHLTLDTTIPHTTVHYPIPWTKVPAHGAYQYHLTVWWDGGSVSQAGTFRIG